MHILYMKRCTYLSSHSKYKRCDLDLEIFIFVWHKQTQTDSQLTVNWQKPQRHCINKDTHTKSYIVRMVYNYVGIWFIGVVLLFWSLVETNSNIKINTIVTNRAGIMSFPLILGFLFFWRGIVGTVMVQTFIMLLYHSSYITLHQSHKRVNMTPQEP